jgi:hypothetical protein
VPGCAPCAFLSSSPDLYPSLCCHIRNFADIGAFEKLGAVRITKPLSFFERMSPDDAECGVRRRILGETDEALN